MGKEEKMSVNRDMSKDEKLEAIDAAFDSGLRKTYSIRAAL